MGRSVGSHPRSVKDIYFVLPELLDVDDELARIYFADAIDELVFELSRRYPSLYEGEGWAGREGRVIAENRHGQFVLYEYCGMLNLCLVPEDNPLSTYWMESVSRGVTESVASIGNTYTRLGTFSNGENLYERAR